MRTLFLFLFFDNVENLKENNENSVATFANSYPDPIYRLVQQQQQNISYKLHMSYVFVSHKRYNLGTRT